MNTPRSFVSLLALGGFMIAGTSALTSYVLQKLIRKTVIYKNVEEIVNSTDSVVQHLGKPIKPGDIKLIEKVGNIKTFSAKLTGSKTKGVLNCNIHQPDPNTYEVEKLEIQYSDIPNQFHTFYTNEKLKQ